MAQRRAQIAEAKAESAFSGVGVVADQTRHAQSVAEPAIAEARFVRDEVSSRIAEVAKRSDVSVSNVADVLTGKVQQVAAQFEAQTSHAVGQVARQLEQEVKAVATSMAATVEHSTRAMVEDVCREFKAQFDQTHADSQRKEEETKRQVDQIAEGLKTLTEQLNLFKPASVVQVQGSQKEISAAVEARLNLQSSRIDAVDESVQRTEKTAVENAEILHNLLVGMENLSDNVKQLKKEMKEYGDLEAQEELDVLLQEADETIPVAKDQVPLSIPPPVVSESCLPTSAPILSPRPSSSNVGGEDLIKMQEKLDALRFSQPETTRPTIKKFFNFDTPASMTLPYLGLDGHPRRITPIPVSLPLPPQEKPSPQPVSGPLSKFGWYWSELSEGWHKTAELVEAEKRTSLQKSADEELESAIQQGSQLSGTSRSTIGNTFIPPEERARIREEVQAVIHQTFLGIRMSTVHNSEPGKSDVQTVNTTNPGQNSVPIAIAGSEVSVASTRSNVGTGKNQNSFSRMMTSAGAVNSAQTFANVQWRPKEPPCYYGRSTEDVHMWTSLVRHYFAFMGGNDAQQVAYAVTLLRDSAMSGIQHMREEIVKCPEIGRS